MEGVGYVNNGSGAGLLAGDVDRVPDNLLGLLHNIWRTASPDLFQVLYWWDGQRNLSRTAVYTRDKIEESDFINHNTEFMKGNAPFKTYTLGHPSGEYRDEAYELSPGQYGHCGFISNWDTSGLTVVVSLCFREKNGIDPLLASEILSAVTVFFQGEPEMNQLGFSLKRGVSGIERIAEDYLRSMQEMSSRFTSALKKQVISQQLNSGVASPLSGMSLSARIIQARDRTELSAAINEFVQDFIAASGAELILLDTDQRKLSPLMPLLEVELPENHQGRLSAGLNYDGLEALFGNLSSQSGPRVLHLKDHAFQLNSPNYPSHWGDPGIESVAGVGIGGETGALAYLLVYFNEKTPLDGHEQLRIISLQVSLALSNILERENQQRLYADHSRLNILRAGFSGIKTRADLLRAIENQLRKLVVFSDFVILLKIPEDSGYFYFLDSGFLERYDNRHVTIDQIIKEEDFVFSPILGQAVCIDENHWKVEQQTPVYIQRVQKRGAKEMITLPLTRQGTVFAKVCLFSENAAYFGSLPEQVLDLVSGQLASGLLSVLSSEELEKFKEERNWLGALTRELALVRTPWPLVSVITNKVKKMFRIDNFTIFIIDKEKKGWRHFELDPEYKYDDDLFPLGFTERNFGFTDKFLNEVANLESYRLYDEQMHLRLGLIPEDLAFWRSIGITEEIGFPLRIKDETIGAMFVHMEKEIAYELINFSLLQDTILQISVAIANITNHETMSLRESEKSKLLTFNERLALTKNRKELSRVIRPYLWTIFGIREFILGLKDTDEGTFSCFIHGFQTEDAVGLGGDFMAISESPQKGSLTDQVMVSDEPLVFAAGQFLRSGALWKHVGAERVMGFRLRAGIEDMGILWVRPEQASELLLKGISLQIATAIYNVSNNEEVVRKEAIREALLSVNVALSTVRDSSELQKLINSRLKKLLGCSHAVIARIDEDKVSASAYLTDPASKSKNHPDYDHVVNGHFLINDGLMGRAAVSASPIVFDLDEIAQSEDPALYALINHQKGLKGMAVTRLLSGNELFGFWIVFFEEKAVGRDRLELLDSLANQIGIAIFRITTYEEIHKRGEENTRLLEFSREIASLREKEGLARILKVQLTRLFDIEDFTIFELLGDGQSYRPLLYQSDHAYLGQPEFLRLINREGGINDGVFDVALASQKPSVHDLEEIALRDNPPHYVHIAKAVGLKKMVTAPLRIGTENIALFIFRYKPSHSAHIYSGMFKSICSLLAIAVENIISNEKVTRQLVEINDYKQQLEDERVYLKEELQINQNYGEIIGKSPQMQETYQLITQVAPSDSTVLILGETGTGKELIARAIHNNSTRKNKLMVKVNCAALPANLIESELFGHERGSFTGATDRRIGKFELANNGTLFLDEIGEMPVELQVKLLRALQEKEIERIGGKGVIKVNVRVIAATNRDLEKEMDEGRFRRDLYYRLNIFPILLSPLRDRLEDIPMLANHFISRYSKKTGRKIIGLSSKVLQELLRYTWPGNIRELEHLLERSVLLAKGNTLKQIDLPKERIASEERSGTVGPVLKTIDENERDHILQILKYCKGKISGADGAAALLGVPTSTLNSKVKKLGIRREFLS